MALRQVERDKVRIGIVGCGVVAKNGHIPAILKCDDVAELVGFADPEEDRRRKMTEAFGKPAFASFEEMADALDLDAVAIPTHPHVRLPLVRTAAQRGLHVFSEKPLTNTAEEAEEIVRLMDDAGLFLTVAFVYRGKACVQRMMALLREGVIGRLRAVHIENMWDYHGVRGNTWGPDFEGRRHRALRNLGTLDCGVHDLDLARYFTSSDFESLQAVGTIVEDVNVLPDHLMIQARMANGMVVAIEESAVWGFTATEKPVYQQSYRLVGESGVMRVGIDFGHEGDTELYVVSGEKQWREKVDTAKGWQRSYRQFFETLLDRSSSPRFIANGQDALANMRAASLAIEQASCNKRP